MGDEGFAINPAELHAAANIFAAEATRFQQAFATWQAEVARIGNCFGNDENGKKMKADHDPNKDAIARALGIMAQGVASVAPALRDHADNTVDRDQANATTLS